MASSAYSTMEMLEINALHSHIVSTTVGNFVVKKTHCHFSTVPINQAHEQNDRIIKGEGGSLVW